MAAAVLCAVIVLAPVASQPRRNTVDSRSPLHQASYVADVTGVQYWLELAKMHAPSRQHFEDETGHRDDDGRHALFVCGFDPQVRDAELIDENCAEIAAKLLDAGVQANARDRHGWSLVAYVASLGHARVLRALAGAGAHLDDPGWGDAHERTPLAVAAMNGRTRAVDVLLELGVRPDTPDEQGWTPLHHAVRNAREDTGAAGDDAPAALANGGDRAPPAANGASNAARRLAIAEALLAAGARVDVIDEHGAPPLAFDSRAAPHAHARARSIFAKQGSHRSCSPRGLAIAPRSSCFCGTAPTPRSSTSRATRPSHMPRTTRRCAMSSPTRTWRASSVLTPSG